MVTSATPESTTPERGADTDAPSTRTRILNQARMTFARTGFAGARIDQIAADAGVNKRMIYHYFGSKKGLYAATVAVAQGELATTESEHTSLEQWADACSVPEEDLRLLAWDGLLNDAAAAEPSDAQGQWQARAEQAAGLGLDNAVDPRMLVLLMLSLDALPKIAPGLAAAVSGQAVTDPEFAQRTQVLRELILKRLRRPKQKLVLRPATRPGG